MHCMHARSVLLTADMGTQQDLRDLSACLLQEGVPLDEHLLPISEDSRLAEPARAPHQAAHRRRAQHSLQDLRICDCCQHAMCPARLRKSGTPLRFHDSLTLRPTWQGLQGHPDASPPAHQMVISNTMLAGDASWLSSQVSRCTSLASAAGCAPSLPALPRSVFALPRPAHIVRDACGMRRLLHQALLYISGLRPVCSVRYLQNWITRSSCL